ncbi:MAG: endo alpha-1,4 polygalactosaminidase [Candidatus Roizmanbacteria bacterium]|nr:endo alpha-1,4 polygalactosaminidase [Candidatus Roizmanbacteria bacterium]
MKSYWFSLIKEILFSSRMYHSKIVTSIFFAMLFLTLSSPAVMASSVCQKIIIPAYFYPNPTTLWEQSIASAPTVDMMIVNPASGPGTSVDQNYVAVISDLRQAGITPLGYVTSSYATRTISTIQSEIDQWQNMYGITNIFIDEVTSNAANIAFHQTLYDYIKTNDPNAVVVINPGTTVAEGYVNAADVISIFEGDMSTYQSFQMPSWINNYPASKFLHLVYSVPNATSMQTVVNLSRERNAGYVYITNDVLSPGHPWDTLPVYWSNEISSVNAGCTVPTPTPLPACSLNGDVNCDATVSIADLATLLSNFGRSGMNRNQGDLNSDGNVNVADLSLLLSNFGSSNTQPTPTSMVTPTLPPTQTPAPTATRTPTPTPVSGSWWKPTPNSPIHWHWQLSQDFAYPRDVLPNKTVYDIDGEKASATLVAQLHALGPNVKVICYFDGGVWEDYRSDAGKFPGSQNSGVPYTGDPQYANVDIIGSKDQGWEGSYWMDIRRTDILRPLMDWRVKNWCKDKGFDAIEPDETEVWSNNNGFSISKAQNNVYNQMIAEIAHSYNLSVGLKGNTTEAGELVQYFDWTLNEECNEYGECNELLPFINANKAVFNIEYAVNPNCTQMNNWHMNSARRDLDLVGPTQGSYRYTPCIPDTQNNW